MLQKARGMTVNSHSNAELCILNCDFFDPIVPPLEPYIRRGVSAVALHNLIK